VWAYVVLGETVTGVQAVGMVVVIAALAAFTISSRRAVPSVLDTGELGGPSG
jgi:drug/metabolite transporter (DMT)-like permease